MTTELVSSGFLFAKLKSFLQSSFQFQIRQDLGKHLFIKDMVDGKMKIVDPFQIDLTGPSLQNQRHIEGIFLFQCLYLRDEVIKNDRGILFKRNMAWMPNVINLRH